MSMVTVAEKAIQEPKVQEMLKELSKYGLGICMPHMHDPNADEEFSPLPKGMVSYESNLGVSFVEASEITNEIPVAWMWNNGSSTANVVGVCVSGGHIDSPEVNVVGVCVSGRHIDSAVMVVGACERGGHT